MDTSNTNETINNIIKNINKVKAVSTKKFGPQAWETLFYMVLGSYPAKFDSENKNHLKIKKAFINTFFYLKYTLPCSFCRESYKIFYKELPIEKFTDSRVNMLKWLYLLKDKVNKKLIKQEIVFYNEMYLKSNKNNSCCFRTKPSPEFRDVLTKLLVSAAKCDKKMKKCI